MEEQKYLPIYPSMGERVKIGSDEEHAELREFWSKEMEEIQGLNSKEVRNKSGGDLPLARVKKIMKADESKMVSAEAVVVMGKACEMMMKELSLRAWIRTRDGKRRTLQNKDIWSGVSESEVFDFLVDVLPRPKPFHPPLLSLNAFDLVNNPFFTYGQFPNGFLWPS
ncbi:hypothetical protein SUGI_0968360 [Cryptomeria japonica]|nr:hypothetical protein SUGI_0968360 [Cryptomeria japonica]